MKCRDTAVPYPYGEVHDRRVYLINVESAVGASRLAKMFYIWDNLKFKSSLPLRHNSLDTTLQTD